ncbi:MAG TPA: hypothetical protein VFC17_09510 [Candidatus Limnocylindrales bacterium]|nr:hypothetical protein [Candidatus Limnocylindrales bacterium]
MKMMREARDTERVRAGGELRAIGEQSRPTIVAQKDAAVGLWCDDTKIQVKISEPNRIGNPVSRGVIGSSPVKSNRHPASGSYGRPAGTRSKIPFSSKTAAIFQTHPAGGGARGRREEVKLSTGDGELNAARLGQDVAGEQSGMATRLAGGVKIAGVSHVEIVRVKEGLRLSRQAASDNQTGGKGTRDKCDEVFLHMILSLIRHGHLTIMVVDDAIMVAKISKSVNTQLK